MKSGPKSSISFNRRTHGCRSDPMTIKREGDGRHFFGVHGRALRADPGTVGCTTAFTCCNSYNDGCQSKCGPGLYIPYAKQASPSPLDSFLCTPSQLYDPSLHSVSWPPG